jgi:hypothetical protein
MQEILNAAKRRSSSSSNSSGDSSINNDDDDIEYITSVKKARRDLAALSLQEVKQEGAGGVEGKEGKEGGVKVKEEEEKKFQAWIYAYEDISDTEL